MTDIIDEIEKTKQGMLVINEGKTAYYNKQEILEGNLEDFNFESFILKVSDVVHETKLRSHVLEENSCAILVIDELTRTREECICLSILLDRVFATYDDEEISSIVGIPFEKDDIFYPIEVITFNLTIGQHSPRQKNIPTIRLRGDIRGSDNRQKTINKDLEFKILELLSKINKIIYGKKNQEYLLGLCDILQHLDNASHNEIEEIQSMLSRIKNMIVKLRK